MIRVGITGNIGSGKTTVCKIFESLGIPIYYADIEAKNLYTKYPEIKRMVCDLLGDDAYFETGSPNFDFIKETVFNNPATLANLNAILHPYVFSDFADWCVSQKNHNPMQKYIIKEAAILFESGANKTVDKTILVSAPNEIKIQRAMQRDNTNKEAVSHRLTQQMPEDELKKLVDFTVVNDGITPLIPQVLSIHKKLIDN